MRRTVKLEHCSTDRGVGPRPESSRHRPCSGRLRMATPQVQVFRARVHRGPRVRPVQCTDRRPLARVPPPHPRNPQPSTGRRQPVEALGPSAASGARAPGPCGAGMGPASGRRQGWACGVRVLRGLGTPEFGCRWAAAGALGPKGPGSGSCRCLGNWGPWWGSMLGGRTSLKVCFCLHFH